MILYTSLSRLIHQLPPILKELQREQQQEKVNPNLCPPYMAPQGLLVSELAQLELFWIIKYPKKIPHTGDTNSLERCG